MNVGRQKKKKTTRKSRMPEVVAVLSPGEHWKEIWMRACKWILTLSKSSPESLSNSKGTALFHSHPRNKEGSVWFRKGAVCTRYFRHGVWMVLGKRFQDWAVVWCWNGAERWESLRLRRWKKCEAQLLDRCTRKEWHSVKTRETCPQWLKWEKGMHNK